jgi:hypothetical protein
MTPELEAAGWRVAHIGFEDDGLIINDVEVWKQPWRSVDARPVELPHPAHPRQVHRYAIHEIGDASRAVRFAACELSNGVWGFYVPVGDSIESQGVCSDGSLRYLNRSGPANGPGGSTSSSAVLIDTSDGRVLADCARWASSRITPNADGSLCLHLQQNQFEVLFRISPANRLFCNVVEPGPSQPLSGLADAVEQARLAVLRNSAVPIIRRISPDGRILVDLVSIEWSNTHWVNSPRVTDLAGGSVVLDLWNSDWDATVSFPTRDRVRLGCRRYRHPGTFAVELDLARKTYQAFIGPIFDAAAQLDALPEAPLADIASGMKAASCRAAAIAASSTRGHGVSRLASPTHSSVARRTAVLILVGALVVIAAATYWSVHDGHDGARKLDVVPPMPK